MRAAQIHLLFLAFLALLFPHSARAPLAEPLLFPLRRGGRLILLILMDRLLFCRLRGRLFHRLSGRSRFLCGLRLHRLLFYRLLIIHIPCLRLTTPAGAGSYFSRGHRHFGYPSYPYHYITEAIACQFNSLLHMWPNGSMPPGQRKGEGKNTDAAVTPMRNCPPIFVDLPDNSLYNIDISRPAAPKCTVSAALRIACED